MGNIKGIVVGAAVLISVIVAVLFFAVTTAVGNQPEHSGLETYEGKLQSGSSMFRMQRPDYDGLQGSIVELTFEDGRTFTAPEQMAAQANMKIGNTYKITYNSTQPEIALMIQEVQQ